ncbi:hypothetical protein [Rhodococcus sp. NPDC058521]|uniref:hypothetical protein n=1 Tax=Rhodococcus sp. NPDC058521 TaxID=3346536 RepID=UPI003660AC80
MLAIAILFAVGSVTARNLPTADILASAALMAATFSIGPFRQGGMHSLALSRRVRACDGKYGPGVHVPASLAIPLPFVAFGLFGATLIPLHRGTGIALLLIALGLWRLVGSVSLSIHTTGVRRRARNWQSIGSREVFLTWDEIDSVRTDIDILPLRVGSRRDPLLRLTPKDRLARGGRLRYDTDDSLAIPTSYVAAEPNALFRAIHDLKTHPNRRHVLSAPAARELLRPNPLRERLSPGDPIESGHSGTIW